MKKKKKKNLSPGREMIKTEKQRDEKIDSVIFK